MRALAVFEGGGAKGFAHIGALQAAEQRGIKFERVAGTSIGAVIAALVSAGYSGHELFHIDGRTGERGGLLNFDPLSRLTPQDWQNWQQFRGDFLAPAPIGAQTRSNGVRSPLRGWLAAKPDWLGRLGIAAVVRAVLRWVRFAGRALKHRLVLRSVWSHFGVTGTEGLRSWLDDALRAKLGIDRPVTFGDLRRCPLKVVATDIVSGQLRVFGGDGDSGLVVADAVVASASFPLFFRPALLQGALHVDGGLLSNLPAWVFDEEIRGSPDRIPIFGFRLVERSTTKAGIAPANFTQFLASLIRATIFGARHLETRGVEDYYVIDLATPIDTLALDEVRIRSMDLVEAGRIGFQQFFAREIGPKDPQEMRELLNVFALLFKQAIAQLIEWRGTPRAALILPRDDRFARVAYSSHEDADDRVLIHMTSPGPASCFSLREPVLSIIPELSEALQLHPLYKFEHALRRKETQTVYALPIFDDPTDWKVADPITRRAPIGILTFDAEANLKGVMGDQGLEDLLAGYAQIAGWCLTDRDNLMPRDPTRMQKAADLSQLIQLGAERGIHLSTRKERELAMDADAMTLIDRVEARRKAFARGPR